MIASLILAACISLALHRSMTGKSITARRLDLTLWIVTYLWVQMLTNTASAVSPQTVALAFIAAYIWHRTAYKQSRLLQKDRPAKARRHRSASPTEDAGYAIEEFTLTHPDF